MNEDAIRVWGAWTMVWFVITVFSLWMSGNAMLKNRFSDWWYVFFASLALGVVGCVNFLFATAGYSSAYHAVAFAGTSVYKFVEVHTIAQTLEAIGEILLKLVLTFILIVGGVFYILHLASRLSSAREKYGSSLTYYVGDQANKPEGAIGIDGYSRKGGDKILELARLAQERSNGRQWGAYTEGGKQFIAPKIQVIISEEYFKNGMDYDAYLNAQHLLAGNGAKQGVILSVEVEKNGTK